MILRSAAVLAAIGIAIGTAGALAASALRAWPATRVNPLVALKSD